MADRDFFRLLFGEDVARHKMALKPVGLTGVLFDDDRKFSRSRSRKSIQKRLRLQMNLSSSESLRSLI